MTTVKKMLISFTAGAVLGMLYAPYKGAKSRRKLSSIGRNIKSGWNNIADSVANRIDNISGNIDNIADASIERVESTQFTVNDKAGFL